MSPDEIRTLRVDLGLTQGEMSQLVGAHMISVSKWERGLARPNAFQQGSMIQFRAAIDGRVDPASVRDTMIRSGRFAAIGLLYSHLVG